jgi:hypothetical protein
VNLAGGPRVDADGDPLPDDWMPLGAAYRVNRLDELLVVDSTGQGLADLYEGRFEPLKDFSDENWAPSWRQNATAAGDFDGDGRDELFIASYDADARRVDAYLHDDASGGYGLLTSGEIASFPDMVRIRAVAGDFDGDGSAEAAVGLVGENGSIEIFFLRYQAGAFQRFGRTVQLARQLGGDLHLSLTVGQLDKDLGRELVYVVNEYFDRDPSVTFDVLWRDGAARFGLLDDATTGFADLAGGPVGANVAGSLRLAKSAGAALADIDADGFDEVVLGGLTRIGRPDGSVGTAMGYLLYALDDARHGFLDLGAHFVGYENPNTNDRPDFQWLEYVHVGAADLDGDTVPEARIAHLLFTWANGGWAPAGELPFHEVVFPNRADFVHVSEDNSRSAVARIVDGTRDNILTWSHELDASLHVWGMVQGVLVREDVKAVDWLECLQPADVDDDTLALEYVEGSHRFIFTEPVIIAVLAAAPCGAGQDPDDCRTQFGVSDSSGSETEQVLSMTAGVVVGIAYDVNIPFVPLDGEATHTVSKTVEHATARAYEVTQTVVWETGPIEDSVILTAVPYDQYRYRVVSPGGNEEYRDREVVVSIPRRPVQLMVSREFYDASVLPDAPKAGAAFSHTPGDTSTYLTFSQAMSLVNAHEGIASDAQDVGQGGGNVSVTLEVGEAHTQGTSITESWSDDLRGTAGVVMAGYTVGESTTDALRLTTGRKLIYGGTVGQIDAAHFASSAYSFGIFAYPRTDPDSGRSYQVINYWATPLN